MTLPAQPRLEPGRAYRTRELRRWGANPVRLAGRLVREGRLRRAAHGLYYAPVQSHFGQAPPSDAELLRAFLGGSAFVITGPPLWNALGLGSTALLAATVVYNTKRSCELTLDGRRFLLRRVLFPESPPPEWFVIDLIQHHGMAGISREDLREGLVASLRSGRWRPQLLRQMAESYGARATLSLVDQCLDEAQVSR